MSVILEYLLSIAKYTVTVRKVSDTKILSCVSEHSAITVVINENNNIVIYLTNGTDLICQSYVTEFCDIAIELIRQNDIAING